MKSSYQDRYNESYEYSQKFSLPWLESQGFQILSDEELNCTQLDKIYSVDYTAISPKGEKVGIMMRNMHYKSSYNQYNFVVRQACLKTNNLREYYRLSSTMRDFKNSKVFKEHGITDYIFVQCYKEILNGKDSPLAFTWTPYKNIMTLIEMGHFSEYTVGKDRPAKMMSVAWKELRLNKLDIYMTIYKPNRVSYNPIDGLQILPPAKPIKK